MAQSIYQLLQRGNMRTTGKANDVVVKVLEKPAFIKELIECLYCKDKRIRFRAADALEKVGRKSPDLLLPHKEKLINEIAPIPQQEIQWHMAQIFNYLELSEEEMKKVTEILFSYLTTSKSNIAKVMSLQTLTDFVAIDYSLYARVTKAINERKNDSPALAAQSRKLLAQLDKLRYKT